jgi:hypothetical protein
MPSVTHANMFVGVLSANPVEEFRHARFVAKPFSGIVSFGQFLIGEKGVNLTVTGATNPDGGSAFAFFELRTRFEMMLGELIDIASAQLTVHGMPKCKKHALFKACFLCSYWNTLAVKPTAF